MFGLSNNVSKLLWRFSLQEKVHRSWGRSAVRVLICVGIVWAVCTEAINLMTWHFARSTGNDYPNLAVLPKPLPSTPSTNLSGVRIEHFGFSFQVPWKDLDQDQWATDTAAVVPFRDGGRLLIFNPATQIDSAKILHGNTASQTGATEEVFGERALSSNYELMAAEVETTPDQIKWWNSRKQNTRNGLLLTYKSLDLRNAHEIYRLASGELRGFQFGNPIVAPYVVQLDLFDPSDRHYRILVTPSKQKKPVITQAQINALVASIH